MNNLPPFSIEQNCSRSIDPQTCIDLMKLLDHWCVHDDQLKEAGVIIEQKYIESILHIFLDSLGTMSTDQRDDYVNFIYGHYVYTDRDNRPSIGILVNDLITVSKDNHNLEPLYESSRYSRNTQAA